MAPIAIFSVSASNPPAKSPRNVNTRDCRPFAPHPLRAVVGAADCVDSCYGSHLANAVGGIDEARATLDVLEKLGREFTAQAVPPAIQRAE